MATVNEKMTAIADNIRAKTGGTEPLTLDGMAESIPDVYSAGQSSMVDPDKLIPKTVSGAYISVDDVSEIPHKVGCKVESVNLFEWNGGTFDSYKTFTFDPPLPAGTYTMHGIVESDETSKAMLIRVIGSDSGTDCVRATAWTKSQEPIFRKHTFTSNEPVKTIYLYSSESAVSSIGTYVTVSELTLNRGATALPYTPYVKPEEVKVTRCERNLFDVNRWYEELKASDVSDTPTHYGTDGEYDYIAVSHAGHGALKFKDGEFAENTQYTLSFSGKTSVHYYTGLRIFYDDGTYDLIRLTTTWTKYTHATAVGKTVQNIMLYNYGHEYGYYSNIMLNIGTTALPYEPYNGQTLTPTADGTVEGMTSVSPYMNVFSDTEGVNIEVTYNKSWGMQTEYDRFWDVFQNYGKRDNYYVAFFAGNLASSCWNNDNFKPKYPIKPVNAQNMFCNINIEGDLTQIADIDFSNATNVAGSINYCPRITRIGVIDLRKVTTNGLSLVSNCTKLATIDEIIFKNDGSQYSGASGMVFTGCTALKNLIITGKINFLFNTQPCPLSKASITSVINALYEGSSGQTLTLNLSAVNTAFETSTGANDGSTSAEFAALVATKTNWTITMI